MTKKLYYFLFAFITFIAIFTRFHLIDVTPPSLYWEEVALGYDAYSIAQTGHDHHGNFMPIVAFESFGDWKPSGYFYAAVPFIKALGLTSLAVRLPSMISGVVLVLVVGQIAGIFAKTMTINKGKKTKTIFTSEAAILVAMAVTAVSPWAIMFSRAAWEVNLATALLTTGMWLFFRLLFNSTNKKTVSNKIYLVYLLPVVLLFVGAMYTYHSTKIVVPLLVIGMIVSWIATFSKNIQKELKKRLPVFISLGIFALLLLSPLIVSLTDTTVNQRFTETSIFSNLEPITKSNYLKQELENSPLSKALYHRYVLFGKEVMANYLDHFTIDFLFASGDQNPRHSVQYFGQLYHIEFLFILLGIYVFIKKRNIYTLLSFYWLLIGVIPAAITLASPHALRILPVLPVFLLLISFGILHLFNVLHEMIIALAQPSKRKAKSVSQITSVLLIFVFVSIYTLEFIAFWHHYTNVYPKIHASQWQDGYKEMIINLQQKMIENPNKKVYISREAGRPAMYYWFYTQTDPRQVQAQNKYVKKDQGEYLEFDSITFGKPNISEDSNGEQVINPAIIYAEYSDGEWVMY